MLAALRSHDDHGVGDASTPEMAPAYSHGLPPEVVATQIVKESVQAKGQRDDMICIVADILLPEKITPSAPPPKNPRMGVFKAMFRKKSNEQSSYSDRECSEPDIVEEIYADGSAALGPRV